MPYTMNGIGTWYYGKRNVQARMDTCEFCGKYGQIRSYDTTLYFVFIFVPLIPLSQKRVINECPVCHKHRVCALKDFNESLRKAIDESVQAYRKNPADISQLTSALKTLESYQDREGFKLMAPAAAQRFAGNADVQCMVAEGWYYFEDFEAAAAAWKCALALRDSPATRENLARAYSRMGRPRDALPLVRHILTERLGDRVGLLYLIAQIFMAAGDHAAARKLLDEVAQAFPAAAETKEFKKLQKLCRRDGRPVKSALMKTAKQPGAKAGRVGWTVSRLVGPALLLLFVIGYLVTAWDRGHAAKVYVVNGLDRPYRVEIDGAQVRLPPGKPYEMELPEGVVRIHSLDPQVRPVDQVAEWHTSFWSRPFSDDVVVINPDRTAILVRETTYYSSSSVTPMADTAPRPSVGAGQLLHVAEGANFVFQEFPQKITMKESADREARTRLFVYEPGDVANSYRVLAEYASAADRRGFVEGMFSARPDDSLALTMLVAELGASNAIARMKSRMNDTPVLINLHRVYQSMAETMPGGAGIEAEYRQRLARDPQNPAWKYLLGRVLTNRVESETLFLAAEQGPKPIGYGYNALAFAHCGRGEFEKALEYADKARGLMSDGVSYRETVLYACRRYEELLAMAESACATNTRDFSAFSDRLVLLQLLGRTNEIDKVGAQGLHCIEGAATAEDLQRIGLALRMGAVYASGDTAAYLLWAQTAAPKQVAWFSAVVNGDAKTASAQLAAMTNASKLTHGLVYAMARKCGDEELAAKEFGGLMAGLRAGGVAERHAAAFLDGSVKPTAEDLGELAMMPADKVYVLLAMGWRDPTIRDAAFALARKLNFMPAFPQREIDALARGT